MKVCVTDPKGNRKEYKVKPLDTMTVADWVTICSPPLPETITEGFERLLELTARHTTIPRKALDKMPARDVRALVDSMALMLEDAAKHKEEAEKGTPPTSFKFKGEAYRIPHNIEAELTFGQYESLTKVLLPPCETEADMYASILAVCCLPEGEEFDGAKVNDRKALFMGLPLRTAMDVCAFFFRQQRTTEERYQPYKGALPRLLTAQSRAGVDQFVEFHGSMMDYRHAAKLEPLLRAMYGPRETVGAYPLGAVLREIKADIDGQRLQDWTSHEFAKMAESEARSRRKGKR